MGIYAHRHCLELIRTQVIHYLQILRQNLEEMALKIDKIIVITGFCLTG